MKVGESGTQRHAYPTETRNNKVSLTIVEVRFDDEMVTDEGNFIVGLMYSAAIDIEVSISLVDWPL